MFSLFCSKTTCKINCIRYHCSKSAWNILFFGSDQFSLSSLKLLNKHRLDNEILNKLEVVTRITKNPNVIQKYAVKEKLTMYNWPDLPSNANYDVGIVVSFGYLIPEPIINRFPYGILNVHASLLPKLRGAAPIIHAIANGDNETGVTVMRIKPQKFDIGDILLQEKVPISEDIEMPELHQKLAELGAQCLAKVLKDLPTYIKDSKPQTDENASYAPKILPNFAIINWNKMSSVQVFNLYRALKGFMLPVTLWHGKQIKLNGVKLYNINEFKDKKPGCVIYSKKMKVLSVLCADNHCISVDNVVFMGKKMTSADFNNGFLCKVPLDLRFFT